MAAKTALLKEATRVAKQDVVAMLSLGKGISDLEEWDSGKNSKGMAYFFLVVQFFGFKGSCGSEKVTM